MQGKLFVSDGGPAHDVTAHAFADLGDLTVYSLSEMDGLAAASAHGIDRTPSMVVVDSGGREVAAWRGTLPGVAELRALLAN
jgi:hypothetical protein